MRRIFIVDVLRFYSAIIVLLSHSIFFAKSELFIGLLKSADTFLYRWLWNFTGAHPGVLIFIVLSGFLIHLPHQNKTKLQMGRAFWVKYILKRTTRILPMYIICATVGIVVSYFFIKDFEFDMIDQMASFLTPFFKIATDKPSGNEILSTVVTEFWIYILIYPLFVLSKNKRIVLIISAIVYFLNFLYYIFWSDRSANSGVWFGRNFFAFQFVWLIGALFCDKSYMVSEIIKRKGLKLSFVLAFFLFVLVGYFVKFQGFYIIGNIVFVIFISVFVIMFKDISISNNVISRLSNRVYSIYAIHYPAFILFSSLYISNMQKYDLLLFICVFFIIEIVYRLVEKPTFKFAKTI